MKTKKKKIIVKAYVKNNLGDDLFIHILCNRYKDYKFILLSKPSTFKEENVKYIKTFWIRVINKFLKKVNYNYFYLWYASLFSDTIVQIGGSIFQQGNGGTKHLQESKHINKYFKRKFIIGANFGPFTDESYYEGHKKLFSQYDDICFRDIYSYNLFTDCKNVRIASDVVLSYSVNHLIEKKKQVGISIIDLKNHPLLQDHKDSYNNLIIQLMKNYIWQGYEIKLLSFCKDEGDEDAARETLNHLNKNELEQVEIIKYNGNINSFISEFAKCEIIYATRFHALILGIIYQQKIVPLIYSKKTVNVLDDFDYRGQRLFIENLHDINVDLVIRNAETIEIDMKATRKSANQQFEGLDAFLNKRESF